ncbi:MAG: tetratricopeptide repeat protein [Deltaproteobacteria bacterium]|nr:tetratricopeptide repeat protein [Deltaproteobacteria bacterium]
MGESLKWAEFAMLAEGHRRAGLVDQAEQLARTGIDEHPDSPEGALVLALTLLDQDRIDEARRVIEGWADTNLGVEVTDDSTSAGDFSGEVSDVELESAFASAETDRDEVIDADAIAQQAMREAKFDPADEFTSPNSSFATRTVADLLSKQGDEDGASRIRAVVDSAASATAATGRNTKAKKIARLERWLSNIKGGMQ